MPGTHTNLEKIRAELAWVAETPDPNKCGRRNVEMQAAYKKARAEQKQIAQCHPIWMFELVLDKYFRNSSRLQRLVTSGLSQAFHRFVIAAR